MAQKTGDFNARGQTWVFVTNSNFLIPIFVQPDDVNLWYFKVRLFDQLFDSKFELSKIYDIEFKDIGIRKSEFVGKTQIL